MRRGFTIVELLIVIVVIAILAAITVVAYTGVQNQANDAAVRSDLANIAKQYEIYKVENDLYPYGSVLNNGMAFVMNIAKQSYDTSYSYQLLNCTTDSAQGSDYAMLAVSKSGKKFYVSSVSGGVREYTGSATWLSPSTCTYVLSGTVGNGAGYGSNTWRTWTGS